VIKTPCWCAVFVAILMLSNDTNAQSQEPFVSMLPKTIRAFFVMDPMLSEEGRFINRVQQKAHLIALADTSASAIANDVLLMSKPTKVCSGSNNIICHDMADKYVPKNIPVLFSGLYKINRDVIFTFGVNSGFDSSKLSVSPSLSLGGGRRWYLSGDHTSHIILEGNYWFGSVLTHRPCLDSYHREYYCPTLTAWSDFSYDPYPKSFGFRLTSEKLF